MKHNKRRILAKIISSTNLKTEPERRKSNDEKIKAYTELQGTIAKDPNFLFQVITEDESLVYGDD